MVGLKTVALPALLLHAAAVAAFGGAEEAKEFTKVELPNAKCLDGSPAVYYIAANASSSRWVIWLEGGGNCLNLTDCVQRAKGRLGSSASYNASIDAPKGMLSSDAAANPDLHTWNRVFVPYCSGDVWMGTKRAAVNPFPQEGAWRGYFHGHFILEDMYEDISDRYVSSSPPTHAVLTGCSAGGMGVIFNCDWFAANFYGDVDVACRPEAGWFGLPQASYARFSSAVPASGRLGPDPRKNVQANWTMQVEPYLRTSSVGRRCVEDVQSGKLHIPYCDGQELGDAECCFTPPYAYAYSKTRMFLSQNSADAYQVYETAPFPVHTYQTCAASIRDTNATAYWLYIRGTIAGSLTRFVVDGAKRAQDGLFMPACLVHCMANWQGPVTLHSKTDQRAFGDWYFRRGGEHMLLDNSTDPAALCACAGSPFPNTAGSSPLAAAAALADAAVDVASHLIPAALADMVRLHRSPQP